MPFHSNERCQTIIRILNAALILSFLMNVVGCYTFKQIAPTAGATSIADELDQTLLSLSKGKRAKLELKDGSMVEGIMEEYDGQILRMETLTWRKIKQVVTIERANISAVHVRSLSTRATIGASAILLGLTAAIIMITIIGPFNIGFAPQNI
ncbi:MAG: hypothetical protein HOH43_02130 [Candidatus Latescibacteria bacterium]|nr:hypothetical protein [Candidatus Latescibacterota bacterium]